MVIEDKINVTENLINGNFYLYFVHYLESGTFKDELLTALPTIENDWLEIYVDPTVRLKAGDYNKIKLEIKTCLEMDSPKKRKLLKEYLHKRADVRTIKQFDQLKQLQSIFDSEDTIEGKIERLTIFQTNRNRKIESQKKVIYK